MIGFGLALAATAVVWWLHRRASGKPFDAQMPASWMRDHVYRSGVQRDWN